MKHKTIENGFKPKNDLKFKNNITLKISLVLIVFKFYQQ